MKIPHTGITLTIYKAIATGQLSHHHTVLIASPSYSATLTSAYKIRS